MFDLNKIKNFKKYIAKQFYLISIFFNDKKLSKYPKIKIVKNLIFSIKTLIFMILVSISMFISSIFWSIQVIKNLQNINLIYNTNNVYDRYGRLIGYTSPRFAKYTQISEFSQKLKDSIISTEDKTFYNNIGISIKAIIRSSIMYIPSLLMRQQPRGGSTITQQIVRQIFLTNNISFVRKIKEIILSILINQYLSKDKIFELYMNNSYFSANVYGFAMASEVFFNKPHTQLSDLEIAILVAMLRDPVKLSPISCPKEILLNRAKVILNNMVNDGIIDEIDKKNAINYEFNISDSLLKYTNFVTSEAADHLIQKYGMDTYKKGGLDVYTSVDLDVQLALEEGLLNSCQELELEQKWTGPVKKITPLGKYYKIVRIINSNGDYIYQNKKYTLKEEDIKKYKEFKNITAGDLIVITLNKNIESNSHRLINLPTYTGYACAMKTGHEAGDILASVGSVDYNFQPFDIARNGERGNGSCMKILDTLCALNYFEKYNLPFNLTFKLKDAYAYIDLTNNKLVYTTAEEFKKIDANYYGKKDSSMFPINNWDFKHFKDISFRASYEHSRNIPFMELILNHVGLKEFKEFLIKIKFLDKKDAIYPSYILGAKSIRPRHFARILCEIANKGIPVHTDFIKTVKNRDTSEELESYEKAYYEEALFSKEVLSKLYSCMNGCVNRGTGLSLKGLFKNIYCKTGTNSNNTDAMCVCFVGDYVFFLGICKADNDTLGDNVYGARKPVLSIRYALQELKKKNKIIDKPIFKNNGNLSFYLVPYNPYGSSNLKDIEINEFI
jgi:membrane peptidoglycan carboxypeptidase